MSVLHTVGRAALEAVQVALVVVLTVLWSPRHLVPEEQAWLVDVGAATLIALLMMLIRLFALPRAHLDLTWTRETDNQPLREVDVLLDRTTKEAAPLIISVECDRAWGLGWVALYLAVRRGLWVRARADHAKTVLIPEAEREFEKVSTVRSESGFSVRLKLNKPIAAVGDAWNEATVKPRGYQTDTPRRRGLKHTAVVDGRWGWALAWAIVVDSKASKINERWS